MTKQAGTPYRVPGEPWGTELRNAVFRHLLKYPGLSGYDIAGGLHLQHRAGGGKDRVNRQLRRMEADGEVKGRMEPKLDGSQREVMRWYPARYPLPPLAASRSYFKDGSAVGAAL
jgi:hypothetical protein